MTFFIANIAAIIVLFIIVLRLGPDLRIQTSPPAQRLRIAACIFLAIPLAIFLLFGIGEMVGGDISGGMHLVEALIVVLVGILSWKRPFEAGIILCLSSLALTVFFLSILLSNPIHEGPINFFSLLILVFPTLIAGSLLLSAGILVRRTQ
ncbi:MAG: hypothetical protein RBT75_09260 [Anaerolineae bacterium]|jgi:hypothetical protein|nr:hypothetical protein [Anaerolineae bacterium]